MRRYQLTVNNNQYDIDVEELSATDFSVSIDGQTVAVTLNSQADTAQAAITPQIEARSAAAAASAASGVPVAPKVPATMRPGMLLAALLMIANERKSALMASVAR